MSAIMIQKMEKVRSWMEKAVEYLKVKERYASTVTFAKKRPVTATVIGVILATSFLPVVGFVSFVASFLIIGLIALFIVEGTAILTAITILIFALFSSVIVSFFIVVFLISGFVAGRLLWRITVPFRNKIAERLGACGRFLVTASEKSEPQEKGMMETGSARDVTYTSRFMQTLAGKEQTKTPAASAIGYEDEKDILESRSPPDMGYDASQMYEEEDSG